MKKQNGSFRSNVGIPHALTVSLVPGTHFFTKLRNPRTTFRSSWFSSLTCALFLRFLPLPAFTGIPPSWKRVARRPRRAWKRPRLSLRKRLCVYPRHELQRILVVDFLQHFIRHLKSVNPPERVALAVVLKIFVPRFESAEIPLVFVHLVNVFSHQHAVLILDEKIVRRIRLPPQLRQHCGNVHVYIRIGVKKFSEPLQVVPVKSEMRRDEIRLRMLCK